MGLTGTDCSALNCDSNPIEATTAEIAAYEAANTVMVSGSFVRDVVNGWIGESVGGVLMGLTGQTARPWAARELR